MKKKKKKEEKEAEPEEDSKSFHLSSSIFCFVKSVKTGIIGFAQVTEADLNRIIGLLENWIIG